MLSEELRMILRDFLGQIKKNKKKSRISGITDDKPWRKSQIPRAKIPDHDPFHKGILGFSEFRFSRPRRFLYDCFFFLAQMFFCVCVCFV